MTLMEAVKEQNIPKVIKLLQDTNNDPSIDDNYCLKYAIKKKNEELALLLLRDIRVNPFVDDLALIKWCVKSKLYKILRVIAYGRSYKCYIPDKLLYKAKTDYRTTKYLIRLANNFNDEIINNTMCMPIPSTKVVKLLISNSSVDNIIMYAENIIGSVYDDPILALEYTKIMLDDKNICGKHLDELLYVVLNTDLDNILEYLISKDETLKTNKIILRYARENYDDVVNKKDEDAIMMKCTELMMNTHNSKF
jgi:hypothetical protein